ncbi:HEAT repeat domain-containing protein [Streptomyces coeruleorubidus]|uniref:HEAT repeat domain-containing protein n=1 Tax=Streptomyces coeruleorubidus TaxID=116188 RepID=UPI0036AA0979
MDQARVVEVWAPGAGQAGTGRVGTGRVGTGYLLADRLVLTSYHVVQNVAPGGRVEVRPLEVPQRTGWLAAARCWPHEPVDLDAAPDHDAALLVIDGPHGAGPSAGAVRFGRITGQDKVPCVGVGFPDAEARPGSRRDTMPVRGHVDALHARKSGMLTVHVDEGVVPRRVAGGSGWAGSSGTAVFCGPLLVGVLATDRPVARDASVLGAVPVTALAGLPGFRDTLTAHGVGLRLEHASPAARHLADYLTAAHRAATEHPYAGVLPGAAPPLAAVYLRQQVRRLHHDAADRDREDHAAITAAGATAADDVLADPPTCVVVAGPGGGKSSLLRTRMAEGATRFLDGSGGAVLPVLVPAAALTADLPLRRALAEAVTANLTHHGLSDSIPPDIFAAAPQPGMRWLVLIDGLDEVTDPAARHRVLTRVARVSGGDDKDLYRFVIATRPLPDGTLDTLGADVPRYDLQPFGDDDLPQVASGWFRAAGLPHPDAAAERFVLALDGSRLTALARVPLMAAMLCQLHAAAPDQPLPAGRGGIYDRFITLLHKRQHTADASGSPSPLLAGVDRYGPAASAQAEITLDQLEDITGHLAAERQQARNTRPALDIVQSHPSTKRPDRVPADDWNAFLSTALRGSGQLIAQAGDLVFLHQTLQEHLAARHLMKDRHTGAQVLRRVFHRPYRYWPSDRGLGIEPRVWGSRYWVPPREDPSYVGFLLDAAHHSGLTAGPRYLSRLARSGVEGCDFIVELAGLGTALPDETLHSTANRLYRLAQNSFREGDDRVSAAWSLAELGDPRAADLLYGLAHDTTLEGDDRVEAAGLLAELGDPRAADPLYTLAHDTTLSWGYRVDAAESLVELGDPRAADLLYALAQDTTLDRRYRVQAAESLVELGDPRAADTVSLLQ